ncbi:Nn.00g067100.m01.CDS01 [Neocucurbitaria sp. VM-36]
MAPDKLQIKRKPSNLSKSNVWSSTSVPGTSNLHPVTPRSVTPSTPMPGRRHTSGGLRSLIHRFRDPQPEFEMLTPPSSSPAPKNSPTRISKLAKAFVDSLNVQQLSNFLTWILYYDVVELPSSSSAWYENISSMEMRGWVALGDFLSNTTETAYGFDLVVLDSICDRIKLRRTTVHPLLIQFANPKKMAYTQIATTVHTATADGKTEVEILEAVQAKLHALYQLAANLNAAEGSIYDVWHAVIQKRLRGFLHLVIDPRIAHLRSGAPLITATTSEHLPKEIKDGIRLRYMYEALQQERLVPLERYGIHPATPERGYPTPFSSPPDAVSDMNDAELARSYALQLMKENQDLYAQIAKLIRENEELVESNENLKFKVATLRGIQAASHSQADMDDSQPITTPFQTSTPATNQELYPTDFLQAPLKRLRPRSLSHNAGKKLAAELDAKLNVSQRSHARQHSELLSWKYQEVFSQLEDNPLSAIRLSDPKTGELIAPPTRPPPPIPRSDLLQPGSKAEKRSRRSGMIFDAGYMARQFNFGEATPHVHESDDEEEVVDVPTPTPAARKRLTYD